MVSVAVCTVVGSGKEDTGEFCMPGDDEVKLMPVV